MAKLEVGKWYKLRDGGTIKVESVCQTDTESVMRCTTEANEVVFYSQGGSILPIGGGRELARFNVVGEVPANGR